MKYTLEFSRPCPPVDGRDFTEYGKWAKMNNENLYKGSFEMQIPNMNSFLPKGERRGHRFPCSPDLAFFNWCQVVVFETSRIKLALSDSLMVAQAPSLIKCWVCAIVSAFRDLNFWSIRSGSPQSVSLQDGRPAFVLTMDRSPMNNSRTYCSSVTAEIEMLKALKRWVVLAKNLQLEPQLC